MPTDQFNYLRSPELISRKNSRLLIVDMQQKLLDFISVSEKVTNNCSRLLRAADILGVPSYGTEQYSKGLGPTAESLIPYLKEMPDKKRFSCAECLEWDPSKEDENCYQIVVAGIESHVCVLQTTFDLIALGYRVFVPADAVASRSKMDWEFALKRLSLAGATIVTTESVMFEWCETSDIPEFKQISKLVQEGD